MTQLAQALAELTGDIMITDNIMLTADKGLAFKETAGENLVKGNVVDYDANGKMTKIVVDVPDPCGVVYEDALNNADVWIVKSGIADVLYIGNTTAGFLARGFLAADGGYITGYALAEALPASPFSQAKHFYEIGHPVENRVGAGLAKTNLHFL